MEMEQHSAPAPKRDGLINNLFYWVQTLVYAVVAIVLLFTFVGRLTRVEGNSMLNTLHNGDMLLLQSIGYEPKAGDIVVLNKTTSETTALLGGDAIVKRVVALGGQTVQIDYDTSTLYVDGQPVSEPYVRESMRLLRSGPYSGQTPFVVPEDNVFVLGDNRNESTDSRHEMVGPVHKDYILGRAVCILFPFSDMNLL